MHPKTKDHNYSHSQTRPIDRCVRMKWASTRRVICHLLAPATIVATRAVSLELHASTKSEKQVDPQPSSVIDRHAIDSLKAMSAYLRTLQSFQVEAVLSTDAVMDNGQIQAKSTEKSK